MSYMTKEQLEGQKQHEEERKERCARILCKYPVKCFKVAENPKSKEDDKEAIEMEKTKADKLKEFINKKPEDFKK
jgi:hypothetical protein